MKISPDNQRLFFLHIPKAGGTTFYDILYRNLGFSRVAKIDGTHISKSLADLASKSAEEKRQFRCVAGHHMFGFHKEFDGNFTYITFIRNPVERVVSLYYQIRNVRNHPHHNALREQDLSLLDFVCSDLTKEIANDQTRRISGRDLNVLTPEDLEAAKKNIENHFSFVGICEKYDESLVLLNRRFPEWDMRYVKKNVGKKDRESLHSEFEKVVKEITNRNSFDIQLYSDLEDIFDSQIRNDRFEIADEILSLRKRNAALKKRELRYATPLKWGRRIRNKMRHLGLWLR